MGFGWFQVKIFFICGLFSVNVSLWIFNNSLIWATALFLQLKYRLGWTVARWAFKRFCVRTPVQLRCMKLKTPKRSRLENILSFIYFGMRNSLFRTIRIWNISPLLSTLQLCYVNAVILNQHQSLINSPADPHIFEANNSLGNHPGCTTMYSSTSILIPDLIDN